MLLAGVLCVLAVVAAYLVGREQASVRTDTVECLSAPRTISCQMSDEWTISVPRDVEWTSARDVDRDGRPECLPPTGRGLEPPVEVACVPVEVDGRSWRQVVHVTCLR